METELTAMPYKKSEISAAHIVQAAIRVLARQGYARTSLLDIARDAGMSKGAVHYHFPSKDALIGAVLETACDAVAKRTLEAWKNGGDPLQSLRSSLEELWRSRVERTDEAIVVADLLAQSLYDEALRPRLAAYYRFAASQVETHLRAHMVSLGVEPRTEPAVLSRVLIAVLDGLVMQAFVDPESVTPAQVVQVIESMAKSLVGLGGSR